MTDTPGKPGFSDYIREAFNARPLGMFVPPNWIGLGLFGLLGLMNPGFWVIGAGVELGYLAILSTNTRFQRLVAGTRSFEREHAWQQKLNDLVGRLGDTERRRYQTLGARCRAILEQQLHGAISPEAATAQRESLAKLTWMYLRLLLTRQAIEKVIRESGDDGRGGERGAGGPASKEDALETRLRQLERRLESQELTDELRRSLTGQIEILQQRMQKRSEAAGKVAFLDAELARIEQQVELIREQAVLSTDPDVLSQRIDDIAATLGGTAEWIREQQRVYGALEDLADPPPLSMAPGARESQ